MKIMQGLEDLNIANKLRNDKAKSSKAGKSENKASSSNVENGGSSPGESETVFFSNSIKDLKKIKEAVSNAPDDVVRQEKVDAIKEKVENGNYHVNGKAIAMKMLKEFLI